jgi:hypothetical protein
LMCIPAIYINRLELADAGYLILHFKNKSERIVKHSGYKVKKLSLVR